MHVILEVLQVTLLVLYYILQSTVLLFIPNQWLNKKDVEGQVVLVTGAGSGLGRLLSLEFAKLGCHLVLWDINAAGNEETAAMVRKHGAKVHAYTVDLSERTAVYKSADKVRSEVGDVDVLVNNAGIVTGRKFLDCPDTLIEKTMDVNINAHFWLTKSFLPAMMCNNRGHIVTLASAAGIAGINGLADYCASKFAAVGFDESLRQELAMLQKTGVHTTCVCPFYINTGMFDGVVTRFPWFLPILEPDDAVERIMNAVLTNQEMLFMPRSLYLLFSVKNALPTKAVTLINSFIGVSNAMDDFKGRQKRD